MKQLSKEQRKYLETINDESLTSPTIDSILRTGYYGPNDAKFINQNKGILSRDTIYEQKI